MERITKLVVYVIPATILYFWYHHNFIENLIGTLVSYRYGIEYINPNGQFSALFIHNLQQ